MLKKSMMNTFEKWFIMLGNDKHVIARPAKQVVAISLNMQTRDCHVSLGLDPERAQGVMPEERWLLDQRIPRNDTM